MSVNRLSFTNGEPPNNHFRSIDFARKTIYQLASIPPDKRDYQTLGLTPLRLTGDSGEADCILRSVLDGRGELRVACEINEGLVDTSSLTLDLPVADSEEVAKFPHEPLVENKRFSGVRIALLQSKQELAIRCALAAKKVLKDVFYGMKKEADSQLIEAEQKTKTREGLITSLLGKYDSKVLKEEDIDKELLNTLKFVAKISVMELYEVLTSLKDPCDSAEDIIQKLKPYGLKTKKLEKVYFQFDKNATVSIYEERNS